MESEKFNRYTTASKICKDVYKDLQRMILNGENDVLKLCITGNSLIREKCNIIYTKMLSSNNRINKQNIGVLKPVSISLNNCVSGYVYEKGNDEYNYIKTGDVVKIEMGVYISDALVIWGDTFLSNEDLSNQDTENNNKYIELLDQLSHDIGKIMKVGNLNDDVAMYIGSKCSELDCIPVENCVSYQQLDGMISTDESKWIVLNYQKYYDDEDRVIMENDCFEFEDGEVYNINLTIVKGERSEWKTRHDSHIYYFNNYFYNLKLKSSREFLSKCKGIYGTNGFYISEWNNNPKYKLGIRECDDSGILEDYPVLYENDTVFTKKFTLVVGKKNAIIF